tara:strand:- start:723 stop:1031 length:309 start_codon:yes stop_codon:yes gene_type:complete
MIIYNVTISVEKDVAAEWLYWMKEEHIPEVMNSGCFLNAKINKVIALDNKEETYAIAYNCINQMTLDKYNRNHAPALQKKYLDLYGSTTFIFRTVMKRIKKF